MIRFEHVTKSYGKTTILKDLNFTIPDGRFVILIGPSGCGKTTTMKLINRLLEPDSGIISINGQDIRLQDKVELRRHIGYVIQQIGLFPNMTVAQNISVVPKLLKYDKTRCAEIVQEMLKLVRMEDYAEKYPSELSGGQQKRLCIARALATRPQYIIFDESFSGLDVTLKKEILGFLKELHKELQIGFLIITHDLDTAMYMEGAIHVMRRGKIIETVEQPHHFSDFQEPYSQMLVKAVRSKRLALQ